MRPARLLSLLLPVLIFSSSVPAKASDAFDIDLERIQAFIEKVPHHLGAVSLRQQTSEPNPSTTPIPQKLKRLFKKLQLAAFGRADVLDLQSCDRCIAQAGISSVFVQPSYFTTTADTEFVLAHEISHFLQDMPCNTLETATTVSGFSCNVLTMWGSENMKSAEDVERWLRLLAHRHAEVDVFAVLLLERAGIAFSKQHLEALRRIGDQDKAQDIAVRVATIEKLFSQVE